VSRPSNRAERRARERSARRDFRNVGCRCRPNFVTLDPSPWAAVFVADVAHQVGCPFGDRVHEINESGLTTALVRCGPSRRCQR